MHSNKKLPSNNKLPPHSNGNEDIRFESDSDNDKPQPPSSLNNSFVTVSKREDAPLPKDLPIATHMSDWEFVRPKAEGSGANGCGSRGGWYHAGIMPNGEFKSVFCKQDSSADNKTIRHGKNIAEVVAGQLMRFIHEDDPDAFANVYFAFGPDRKDPNDHSPDETGANVYVVSEKIPGFDTELYKDAYQFARKTPPDARPKLTPTEVKDAVRSGRYRGFSPVILTCVFVDNPDSHSANLAVATIEDDPEHKKTVTFDFAAALKNLDGKLHFGTGIDRYPPGFGPTNHARDYPRTAIVNEEGIAFLEKLRALDPEKLDAKIESLLNYVGNFYGTQPLLEFAKLVGVKIPENSNKQDILDYLYFHLSENLKARCVDAKKLLIEFQVSCCVEKKGENTFVWDNEKLQTIISQNEEYFYDLYKNGKEFHFRIEDLKASSVYLNEALKRKVKKHFFKKILENALENANEDFEQSSQISNNQPDLYKPLISIIQNDEKTSPINNQAAPHSPLLNHRNEFPLPSVKPLSERFNNAFSKIYNDNNEDRSHSTYKLAYALKSFFGFPTNKNPYNYAEWALTGFGLGAFAKNILKFAAEFIPAMIENTGKWIYDHSKDYLKKPADERGNAQTALAYTGLVLGGAFYGTFKCVRLLTMRVTSPIRSAKQAYRSGEELGKKIFPDSPRLQKATGFVFGGVSTLFSIAAITAIAFVASPLVATAATFIAAKTVIGGNVVAALGSAMQWISNAPYVGPAIHTVGNALLTAANALGLNSVAGSVLTDLHATAAATVGLIHTCALSMKVGFKKLGVGIVGFFKKEKNKVAEEQQPLLGEEVVPPRNDGMGTPEIQATLGTRKPRKSFSTQSISVPVQKGSVYDNNSFHTPSSQGLFSPSSPSSKNLKRSTSYDDGLPSLSTNKVSPPPK